MVRHVVERATPENLEDIQRWARALIEAAAERSRDSYFQVKRKLHEVEVRAAHNHVLSQTMSNLHAQSRRFWFTYEPTGSFLEAAEHHGAIVDRIVNRDAEAAVAAVESLFAFLERLTKRALDRRPIF